MLARHFAAVDLGATSGRVILATIGDSSFCRPYNSDARSFLLGFPRNI